IERVGDSVSRKVDVRVISATNQDLLEKIARGLFREDLYYRLKVMEMHLPPLRERREDIALLMAHFRNELNASMNRNVESISDEAMDRCLRYEWPGNIRQLKHCLEHAFVLCRHPEIRIEHLPPEIRSDMKSSASESGGNGNLTRKAILDSLEKSGWNKAKAARMLDVSRQTLYRKMREYQVSTSEPQTR
ncbi:MAG: helix-turn-helix domain-containing protein, partial [Thermodesulfobacteriota bacterium]